MVVVDCKHRLHSQGGRLDSSRIRRKAGGAQRLSLDPETGDRRPPAVWVPWPGAGHSAACGVYSLSYFTCSWVPQGSTEGYLSELGLYSSDVI